MREQYLFQHLKRFNGRSHAKVPGKLSGKIASFNTSKGLTAVPTHITSTSQNPLA